MAVKQFLLWLADLGYPIEPFNAEISAWILLGFQHLHVGRSLDGASCGKELCWPARPSHLVWRI